VRVKRPRPSSAPERPRASARREPGSGARAASAIPVVSVAVLVALLLAARPLAGAQAGIVRAAILVGFTVLAWATELLPEPVVTLLLFLLAMGFGVAGPPVVFSGFESTAWWLVFGGSITAIAVTDTGLGERIAARLFGALARSYRGCVAAVALAAVGLAFLMPSTTGRILLLTPIVLGLARRVGLAPGSTGHTGLVLTVAAASYMPPTTILPANVPNSVLLGTAQALYGVKLTYGSYLALHFPVLGALKTVALVLAVWLLFPERAPLQPLPPRERAPLSRDERVLAAILVAALALFATDFLHGISPAWVSLGAGVACVVPAAGLVPPRRFSERMNLTMLVYVAGFLAVGAIVAESGLGKLVGAKLLSAAHLGPGHTVGNAAALVAIGSGIALLTTLPGLPSVLSPLAGDFAAATALPVATVLMLQVPSFSTVVLPYQSPPMMIAMQLGGVRARDGAKLTLALAAVTVLVLLPLDYAWWRALGWLP
jgi:di/tricarboxylate transporter